MAMNKTQTEHLNFLLEESRRLMTEKYMQGALEHDSTLSEDYTLEELIIEGINESLDGLVYGLTALQKLREQRK